MTGPALSSLSLSLTLSLISHSLASRMSQDEHEHETEMDGSLVTLALSLSHYPLTLTPFSPHLTSLVALIPWSFIRKRLKVTPQALRRRGF
jgi:hypothetical protein